MFGKIGEMKKMYDKYKELQKVLKRTHIKGSAGDFVYNENGDDKTGSVVVVINGEMKLITIDIKDTSLLSPDQKETLEGLIQEAFEKTQSKAQEIIQSKTKDVLGFDPSDLAGMMGGGGMPKIPGLS